MLNILIIIFYLVTPQHPAQSSTSFEKKEQLIEQDFKNKKYKSAKSKLTSLLKESPSNEAAQANLALTYLKLNQADKAIIEVEKALHLNPFNLKAFSLKKEVRNLLEFNNETLPNHIYLLDAIPTPLILFFFALFLISSVMLLGKTLKKERELLNPELEPRLKTLSLFMLSFCFLALFIFKTSSSHKTWVCTNNLTPLHTGPETSLPILQTKPPGSCHKILQKSASGWASLRSQDGPSGWAELKHLTTVRGIQID